MFRAASLCSRAAQGLAGPAASSKARVALQLASRAAWVPQTRHFSAAAADKDDGGSKAEGGSKPARAAAAAVAAAATDSSTGKPRGFLSSIFGAEASFAEEGYKNRWAMVLPAFATHLCIGSPWAWSVMSGSLSRELAIVAPVAGDWTLFQTSIPMSIVFACMGVTAAMLGKWQMRVGVRHALATASACFGGGLLLGSVGIATHQLWLMYLGYGVLGGIGVGIAYTPPIQALIEWFPDRKGMASGVVVAGFGFGGVFFTPLIGRLRDAFFEAPTYLGGLGEVDVQAAEAGRLLATVDGAVQDVVLATGRDLQSLGLGALQEGYYVLGTGASGNAPALACMGLLYLGVMLASAATLRRPHAKYTAAAAAAAVTATAPGSAPMKAALQGTTGNVPLDRVMYTPQFYLLATTFFCVATSAMGIMSVAKPMMSDVFAGALPAIVTASVASSYVMALSLGNLGGRLGWALFMDKFGPRTTFNIFTWGSLPCYLAVPFCVQAVVQDGGVLPLGIFVGTTAMAIACMGGTYAVLPAYEAFLFGSKYVGPIHGRFLLASSMAALMGPSTLLWMRRKAEVAAIHDLLPHIDAARFQQAFGSPMAEAERLLEQNVLTISKLLDIGPQGLQDPTPFLYDQAIYTMAGLMGVAAVSHTLLRPVSKKFFEAEGPRVVEATAVQVPPSK